MATRVAGLGINFGALAVIARWSSQESLGIIIAMNGAAFVGGGICAMGIPTLLLKTMTGYLLIGETNLAAADYRRGVRLVLIASATGIILTGMVALGQRIGWFPSAFGSIGPVELLALGICSLGMAVQFVGLSAIRALKQPALSGLFQFGTPPVLLLGALVLVRITHATISPLLAISALSASVLLNAMLVHTVVRLLLATKAVAELEPIPWQETRSFWLLGVMSSASANTLLLLAAVLLEPAQVAVLGVPFRICNLPMTIVAALGAYYAPLVREAHLKQDHVRQRQELLESQWIGALLVFPVLIAAIIAPDMVLGLFKISDPLANRLFVLFASAQLIVAGCGICEQYLSMIGKVEIAARVTVFTFLGTISVGGFLMGSYGALAGGFAWSIFAVARQLLLRLKCQ